MVIFKIFIVNAHNKRHDKILVLFWLPNFDLLFSFCKCGENYNSHFWVVIRKSDSSHMLIWLSLPCPFHLKFLLVFSDSGKESWTYSCEYFKYHKIPSQTGIWREPLKSGLAPTSPDDWPSLNAESLAHVSINSSTLRQLNCVGFGWWRLRYVVIWLLFSAFIRWNTSSATAVSRFMCL